MFLNCIIPSASFADFACPVICMSKTMDIEYGKTIVWQIKGHCTKSNNFLSGKFKKNTLIFLALLIFKQAGLIIAPAK